MNLMPANVNPKLRSLSSSSLRLPRCTLWLRISAAAHYSCGFVFGQCRCPLLKQIIAIAFLTVSLAAQANVPERKVAGNVIVSDHDPHVRIRLPSSVQYVGADRWILYGMADCELHAFVEADGHKNVERLYWIQFEGYIPSRPELHHTYDSPRHANIGGLDFYVDTWPRSKNEKIDQGSDREHIEALLRAKKYNMPSSMAYVRFVHLLDPEKRTELMIIYGEDLAPTGLSSDDLKPNGKSHDRWSAIEKALIENAQQRIHIQPSSQ